MLNRIFKTKFDPSTGLSYATSELSKNKSIRNISITALASSILFIAPNTALADCNDDVNNPNTIICTADSAAINIDTPNTKLINEGNITSLGKIEPITTNNNATSFIGHNKGTITWNNALSSQDTGRSNAAVNIYYYEDNTQDKNNSFINDKNANIIVNVADNQQSPGIILGIGANSLDASSLIENKGNIDIKNTSSSKNAVVGMIAAGKSTSLNNSGSIKINAASSASGSGIDVLGTNTTGDINIENSGSIDSKASTASGITITDVNTNVKSINIINTGKISADSYGITLLSNNKNSLDTVINIQNSGKIEVSDKGSAVITINSLKHSAPVHIVNTGDLINNATRYRNAIMTSKNDDIVKNTGNIQGNINLGDGDDQLISSAGRIEGKIGLGLGNDSLMLSGTDVTKLVEVNGSDYLDTDEKNVFHLNQELTGSSDSRGVSNNAKIINWTDIHIGSESNSKLNLTGNLIVSKDEDTNEILGQLDIYSKGTLALAPNTKEATIGYNIVNSGNIDLSEASAQNTPEAKLTIKGNYEGNAGSKILLKSVWNNPDEQKTDLVVIEGNAIGSTQVSVVNQILGNVTAEKVEKNGLFKTPVITVKGTDSGVFSGEAKTTNAGKAQLKRVGNSYYWTLKANNKNIIDEPVSGYVQQPYVNQQMMLAQLGKLHERVGEQRYLSLNNAVAEKQLWARTNYDFTSLQGKERFGMDVKSGFIQVGKDLAFNLNQDKSQQHTGMMFTYGWAKSKFFDKFRAENGQVIADKYTGKAHTDMLSLGGYHTYYSANGFYVDTVAQLSWLQNRYNSFDSKVKQNGWGFGASVEIGKAFPLLNPKLAIEPQAQLTYQRVWLNGFNDGTREVKKGSQDNITVRLGTRLTWNESLENNASQLYFTANLIQTLKGRDSRINVGGENVSERYGDLNAEFGVGGQYPINPNLSLYADVRYVIGMQDHSQTHKNSQLSRQSYNGRIGLRYSF